MLLELHFIASKVSTSFVFFLPQIIATTLLDSFKENSTFLALNFNFGKNTKIWKGRRAFLLENIIENWNLFIYFYTLNIPPQKSISENR